MCIKVLSNTIKRQLNRLRCSSITLRLHSHMHVIGYTTRSGLTMHAMPYVMPSSKRTAHGSRQHGLAIKGWMQQLPRGQSFIFPSLCNNVNVVTMHGHMFMYTYKEHWSKETWLYTHINSIWLYVALHMHFQLSYIYSFNCLRYTLKPTHTSCMQVHSPCICMHGRFACMVLCM